MALKITKNTDEISINYPRNFIITQINDNSTVFHTTLNKTQTAVSLLFISIYLITNANWDWLPNISRTMCHKHYIQRISFKEGQWKTNWFRKSREWNVKINWNLTASEKISSFTRLISYKSSLKIHSKLVRHRGDISSVQFTGSRPWDGSRKHVSLLRPASLHDAGHQNVRSTFDIGQGCEMTLCKRVWNETLHWKYIYTCLW